METIGTTTIREIAEYWGHGPEEMGLPPDTDPESTVRAERTAEGGIRLEVEYAGQEDVPIHDRQTRYIPGPDGGIDGFGMDDLPPTLHDADHIVERLNSYRGSDIWAVALGFACSDRIDWEQTDDDS